MNKISTEFRGKSGIYQIRNLVNGKVYIGSAKNLVDRRSQHIRYLNKGNHHNSHLLRAWQKYGKNCFSFEVLEVVDNLEDLINREDYWFERQKSEGLELYNHAPKAGNLLGFKQSKETIEKRTSKIKGKPKTGVAAKGVNHWKAKEYTAISPDGVTYTFRNLLEFCRQHNLEPKALGRVLSGKGLQYKGWKSDKIVVDKRNPIKYKFQNSEGIIYEGEYLATFCKEHGLEYSSMFKLAKGTLLESQGWINPDTFRHRKGSKTFNLISPTGEVYTGTNIAKFAKERGLNPIHLQQVCRGITQSCKGWRLHNDGLP